MQPSGERPLSGNLLSSLLVAAPAVSIYILTGQVWLTVAVCLLLFFLAYGLSVKTQLRENKEIDEALPDFLKDLLEYKRQEYDLVKSLLKIASSNRYNGSFDRIMTRMAIQLKAGTPVDELDLDTRTRLARMTFLVVGEMGRSGGGTIDTVYQLSSYTTKVVEMKRNTMAEMKPYIILSYVSPLLLAFGVTFVGGILGSFAQGASPGVSALKLSGVGVGGVTPAMMQASSILIVVSAAALGVIAAKMVDFTVKNTMRSSLNVIVATIATLVITSIGFQGFLHLL
jgi:flagellar protein FlaJ